MTRQLTDLSAGSTVYLDETVSGTTSHVPYLYLGLDDNGNARLLRCYAVLQRRMHSSNRASYDGCEADRWLENTNTGFLSRFDAATLQTLQNTQIKYVDYNQSGTGAAQVLTIARRCFLLSYSEEGYGIDPAGSEGSSFLSVLERVTGKTGNSARITYNEKGTIVSAWMRSAYSGTEFRRVYLSGGNGIESASCADYWMRPALSVAPTTPVSEAGAERVFLLPDGSRTFWGIDAAMSLGMTARRPRSCKLLLPHESFSVLTIQVCNNYSDAVPTWVSCEDGGVAEFGTEKTGTSWELGVKIHAEAPEPDRQIGEPAMIVAFGN